MDPNPNPNQPSGQVPVPQSPIHLGLGIGRSRGRARGLVLREDQPSLPRFEGPGRPTVALLGMPTNISPTGSTDGRDNDEGEERGGYTRMRLTEELFDVVRRTDFHPDMKIGKEGIPCPLLANYFPTVLESHWKLNHYTVSFEPAEDRTSVKKRIMRQYAGRGEGRFGLNFIFDGASLWTNRTIPPQFQEFHSTNNGQLVLIRTKYIKSLEPGDLMYLHFFNILVKNCYQALRLTPMGRNYFDHTMAISIPQHKLELWPGYVTTLREHDAGLLFGVEIKHKVIRTQDVYSLILEIKDQHLPQGMEIVKQKVMATLVGSIVMTNYNRLTYRVDDIAWGSNPTCTFQGRNGPITYIDYYRQKYGVEIGRLRQPLLISNRKMHDVRRGTTDKIVLIPELCRLTGLTEAMRSNLYLMRDLGNYFFQGANDKLNSLVEFVRKVRQNTEVRTELTNWGVDIEPNPLKVNGRIMTREEVQFRNQNTQDTKKFLVSPIGDFTMAFRQHMRMVTTVPLKTWVIIVHQRDNQGVGNLVQTMQNVAQPLGFMISNESERMVLSGTSSQNYSEAITLAMGKYSESLQMVFVVLPNNKLGLYAAVKKRCYNDFGVSSQCFLAKNVAAKTLMSIATKVVVQMNAKLGGIPWTIRIPVKKAMILGFDVYHSGAGSNNPSIGAMVATTDDTYGKYYSCIHTFTNKNELSGAVAKMVEKCANMHRTLNNGRYPDRVFLYRDGVGEGQLYQVFHTEVAAIELSLKNMYEQVGEEAPKLSVIVVSKRINTRLFSGNTLGAVQSPMPGTVVDTSVTIPHRWDFFLIAQHARQGVVSPTSYNVIFDRVGWSADRVQCLAYKLCHLYYNWSGTVAVPAVCQYAHKLAYLTGIIATQQPCHLKLENLLYFL